MSAAAVGLIGPRDDRALTVLLDLLRDPIPFVRMHAGNALGFLGIDNEVVRTALREAVDDSTRAGREGGQHGLRRLSQFWREHHEFNKSTRSTGRVFTQCDNFDDGHPTPRVRLGSR